MRLPRWRTHKWAARHDVANVLRYGRSAPLLFQRIWLDPSECTRRTETFREYTWSGRVMGGDWDLAAGLLEDHPVIRACRLHWKEGIAWEQTGVQEWLMGRIAREGAPVDGCSTIEDVRERYERLDRTYDVVSREGRLRSRREMPDAHFRERGGIVISVGRRGEPILCWSGHHRLAMAQVLELPRIPAQLQVVHPGALDLWRSRFGPRA